MLNRSARTAIYRLYDEDNDLLYVGISVNPEARFLSHQKEKPWWPQVESIQIDWFEDRLPAEQAEAAAITEEKPRYNIHQTEAWRKQLSAKAREVSPEGRRNRSIGRKARSAQVRKYRELIAQGVSREEASEEAARERERYLEAAYLDSLRKTN